MDFTQDNGVAQFTEHSVWADSVLLLGINGEIQINCRVKVEFGGQQGRKNAFFPLNLLVVPEHEAVGSPLWCP